jgi:Autotransporter beta-domain
MRRCTAAGAALWILLAAGPVAAEMPDFGAAFSTLAEQIRLLFGRTEELHRSHDGAAASSGLHLDGLHVEVDDMPVPLRAFGGFVPPVVKGQPDGRIGTHVSGHARFAPRDVSSSLGIASRGLLIGSDLRLDGRNSIGVSTGYAGTAELEARTLAFYVAHDDRDMSVEALAGIGEADFPAYAGRSRQADLAFGAAGIRWNWSPARDLFLRPSARVDVRQVSLEGDSQSAGRLDASLGLEAAYLVDAGWIRLNPHASFRVRQRFDASRDRLHGHVPAPARVRMPVPSRKPDAGLRLGIVASPYGRGPTFSLEHESESIGGAVSHSLEARVHMRF